MGGEWAESMQWCSGECSFGASRVRDRLCSWQTEEDRYQTTFTLGSHSMFPNKNLTRKTSTHKQASTFTLHSVVFFLRHYSLPHTLPLALHVCKVCGLFMYGSPARCNLCAPWHLAGIRGHGLSVNSYTPSERHSSKNGAEQRAEDGESGRSERALVDN